MNASKRLNKIREIINGVMSEKYYASARLAQFCLTCVDTEV